MINWTSIESFFNVRKHVSGSPELCGFKPVQYKCKVKLHGTNAAVQCHSDGRLIPQSRRDVLLNGKDNCGFAKWVEARKEFFPKNNLVIFGEFCGKGVQKQVAISDIPNKSFVVFAARSLDDDNLLITEPEELKALVENIPDTYVLPWYNECIIDWTEDHELLKAKTGEINAWVNAVENNDPFVESVFGIKGTGEGLVFYPVSESHLGYNNFVNLVFKAKGEKHKNIATSKPAEVDPQVADSAYKFVEMVLTTARLEQGATEVNEDTGFDIKKLGKFIGWICADVEKETKHELEASNLSWKTVSKTLVPVAKTWYMKNIK